MATVAEMFKTPDYTAIKIAAHANALRQKVIASNVANIDTPGYKTRDVSFDKIFERESGMSMRMTLTHPMHMEGIPGEELDDAVFFAYHPANPQDGVNDVDIDREMVKNSETALNFNLFASLLRKKYASLREVLDATV